MNKIVISIVASTMLTQVALGQTSGVPGDGIPDVYYTPRDINLITSAGSIFLPAGWLTVDTDGTDMVAILIGGSTEVATLPTDGVTPGCDLCNDGNLPDPNRPPLFASSWTTGFINGSNQWIRTSPLDTLGYQGVIGQDKDPFDIFPDTGLAFYGPAPDFEAVFDDGSMNWEVAFATLDSGTVFTNVTPFFGSQPPVANDDEYTVTLGGTIDTLRDGLPGLLDNDFDFNGDPLTAFGPQTEPFHGSVTIAADGSFIYTHDGLSTMPDSFTYLVSDCCGSDEGTVTITVVPEPTTMTFILIAALTPLRRRNQCLDVA